MLGVLVYPLVVVAITIRSVDSTYHSPRASMNYGVMLRNPLRWRDGELEFIVPDLNEITHYGSIAAVYCPVLPVCSCCYRVTLIS